MRKDAGWSQRELAARAGVDHSMISRIERGEVQASDRVLRDIAIALGRDLAHELITKASEGADGLRT
jgi:transcriptional regulator with XRE-family HTH domain